MQEGSDQQQTSNRPATPDSSCTGWPLLAHPGCCNQFICGIHHVHNPPSVLQINWLQHPGWASSGQPVKLLSGVVGVKLFECIWYTQDMYSLQVYLCLVLMNSNRPWFMEKWVDIRPTNNWLYQSKWKKYNRDPHWSKICMQFLPLYSFIWGR